MSDWTWDKESTLIPPMQALAVYVNEHGSITIRQEASTGEVNDPIIVFPIEYADTVIKGIQKAVQEAVELVSEELENT